MKKILFSLFILSLNAQESSKNSDDEGAAASTSAQAAKRHTCLVEGCGKSFTYKSMLTMHERIHTGEKLFQCQYCGHDFTQKSHLTDHIRIHMGERPYKCTYAGCGQSFTQSSTFMQHISTHTGKKPHACTHPGCTKSFLRPWYLKEHMRRHANKTLASKPPELSYRPEDFDPDSFLNLEDEPEIKEPSPKRQRLEKDNV